MPYDNRFGDGHSHNSSKTSAKGFPQCSKCGKLMLTGSDMKKMRNLRGSSSNERSTPKRKASSSSKQKSKQTRKRTSGQSDRGSAAVGTAMVETIEGRLPRRADSSLPRGATTQKTKSKVVLDRIMQKLVQGSVIKDVGVENTTQDIKDSFRKVSKRS